MSRAGSRQRPTPPLNDSAWPLYLLICKAQHRAANKFEFIIWLTDRVRPCTRRGCDIEEMKFEVLKGIRAELDALALHAAGPPFFGEYCLACALGIVGAAEI